MCCSAVCPKLAILNETSGVISSPFYPRNYPGNQTCSWEITATKGNHVVLIIEDMYIQPCGVSCSCGHLEIQKGSSFDGLNHLSGRRCGRYEFLYYQDYAAYIVFCQNSYGDHHSYISSYCYHWPLIFHSHRESLKVLFLSSLSYGSPTKMYPGFKATYVQVKRAAMITGKSEQGFNILVAI